MNKPAEGPIAPPKEKILPNRDLPTIGITLGDAAGIGPEIIIKVLEDNRLIQFARVIVYAHHTFFNKVKKVLGNEDFTFNIANSIQSASFKRPNVMNSWVEDIDYTPGRPSEQSALAATYSLQTAVKDMKEGLLDALVTAPIHKANMKTETFPYPGHTEYLGKEFGNSNPLMFLVSERIKVALLTGHLPVQKVPEAITPDLISSKVKALEKSLRQDFLILKPKIAILGLNPHAGDEGKIGDEETRIFEPAIKALKEKGHLVFGPFGADGLFGSGSFEKYDAVLACYHDQGLIPFKMLSFEDGVNFTAGLSVVRTSPDHGTAFDIAGKGKASESSLRAAIFTALEIMKNRKFAEAAPPAVK